MEEKGWILAGFTSPTLPHIYLPPPQSQLQRLSWSLEGKLKITVLKSTRDRSHLKKESREWVSSEVARKRIWGESALVWQGDLYFKEAKIPPASNLQSTHSQRYFYCQSTEYQEAWRKWGMGQECVGCQGRQGRMQNMEPEPWGGCTGCLPAASPNPLIVRVTQWGDLRSELWWGTMMKNGECTKVRQAGTWGPGHFAALLAPGQMFLWATKHKETLKG